MTAAARASQALAPRPRSWAGPAAADRLLLVAPHPDDETLAAGVLLQRAVAAGAAVRVVFATDGEANVWVQRVVEKRFRIDAEARARFGARRRDEALAALAALGVGATDAVFLGWRDCGLTRAVLHDAEGGVRDLAAAIAAFSPTVVVAPSLADVHPDHSALSVLVRLAVDRGPAPRPVLREYVIHARAGSLRPSDGDGPRPTANEVAGKRRALLRHEGPMSVHRAGFLARALRSERFDVVGEPSGARTDHPVRAAAFVGRGLRLDLRPRARLGSFGAVTLTVLACPAEGPCVVVQVDPGGHRSLAPVRRSTGGVVLAPARVVRSGLTTRVHLPPDCFPPGSRVFAKVSRRFGFFDEAGWAVVASSPAPPRAREAGRGANDRASAPRPERPRVCAIVPCYEAAATCAEVVGGAARLADCVIAVDDGSTDGTAAALRAAASAAGNVEVLTFPTNRGKGVALIEAFRRALGTQAPDVLVTVDSDGQHRPEDIAVVVEAWRGGADLAVGTRGRPERMPFRSRFGNTLTRAVLRRLYPRCPADTQSGLRAHDRRLAEDVVALVPGGRYETETHVLLLALSRGLSVAEVPIPTVYIDGNRSSHFRPLVDSMRIYATIGRTIAMWRSLRDGSAKPAPGAGDSRAG